MIYLTNVSVFDTSAECIVNTVNCDGFMGKGLALEFALRYPELEKQYKHDCNEGNVEVGKLNFYNVHNQKIINFPTKDHYQYPSKIEWIESGLRYFILNFRTWGIKSCAFPILGGRNGGLDNDLVIKTMTHYLKDLDIDIYICKATEIGGKEKEMLNKLKASSFEDLCFKVDLTNKQSELLYDNMNFIKRISDIRNIKGIGKETYKKIFNYLNNEDTTLF